MESQKYMKIENCTPEQLSQWFLTFQMLQFFSTVHYVKVTPTIKLFFATL